MQNPNNLIWIDLEMTGLEPERVRLVQRGCRSHSV